MKILSASTPALAAVLLLSLVPAGPVRSQAKPQQPSVPANNAPAKSPLQAAAEKLVIPRVPLADADVADCVDFLRRKIVELDKGGPTAINIVLHPGDFMPRNLSMEIKNASVSNILQVFAEASGLKLSTFAGTFMLHSPNAAPRDRKTAGVADSLVWKSFSGSKLDHVSMSEAEAQDFCAHVAQKASSDSTPLNLLCTARDLPDITLDLRKAAVTDVIELFAELTNQEIAVFGNILVLRPVPATPSQPEGKKNAVAAPDWMKSAAWKRATQITLAQLAFDAVDPAGVGDYLTKKSREEDKVNQGVSVSIAKDAGSISLNLRKVKLSDLLLSLAETHGLQIKVENTTIALVRP